MKIAASQRCFFKSMNVMRMPASSNSNPIYAPYRSADGRQSFVLVLSHIMTPLWSEGMTSTFAYPKQGMRVLFLTINFA